MNFRQVIAKTFQNVIKVGSSSMDGVSDLITLSVHKISLMVGEPERIPPRDKQRIDSQMVSITV